MMVFYAVLSLPYKFSLHVNNNFNSNKKKYNIIQQEFFIVQRWLKLIWLFRES